MSIFQDLPFVSYCLRNIIGNENFRAKIGIVLELCNGVFSSVVDRPKCTKTYVFSHEKKLGWRRENKPKLLGCAKIFYFVFIWTK